MRARRAPLLFAVLVPSLLAACATVDVVGRSAGTCARPVGHRARDDAVHDLGAVHDRLDDDEHRVNVDEHHVSSTSTSTSSTTTVPPPRRITMAFTGDTLVHSPLWRRAAFNAAGSGYDFRPMLERLRPVLDPVDLAVCHFETPIAPEGEALSTAPVYGVPAEIADALVAAAYDRCSTASNHTFDRGSAGIDRTVGTLESVGIEQSGMARTPEEIAPRRVRRRRRRCDPPVVHLSATTASDRHLVRNGDRR